MPRAIAGQIGRQTVKSENPYMHDPLKLDQPTTPAPPAPGLLIDAPSASEFIRLNLCDAQPGSEQIVELSLKLRAARRTDAAGFVLGAVFNDSVIQAALRAAVERYGWEIAGVRLSATIPALTPTIGGQSHEPQNSGQPASAEPTG